MKDYILKDCLRRQSGMSRYALNLKNIVSWYDTELTKAKKRIWKLKDLLDYEKSISDQKQNEINLKYREVIALQEHIAELEQENTELKEHSDYIEEKLAKAKNLIGDLCYVYQLGKNELAIGRVMAEAEQFLKEVKE